VVTARAHRIGILQRHVDRLATENTTLHLPPPFGTDG
jgi:hypothetical protein